MAWVAWEKLTLAKSKDGLGFRDMRAYNQALLAKEAWHLLTTPESLCGGSFMPNIILLVT